MNFLDERLPAAFWDKAIPEPNGGCWIWTGALHQAGYGVFRQDRRDCKAHRFAFETVNGPLVPGHSLWVRCQSKCCVNPGHWVSAPRTATARKRGKVVATRCANGHEYTQENTLLRWGGGRQCRTCFNERGRKPLSEARKRWRRTRDKSERMWRRFGITKDEFDALVATQNGACAICLVVLASLPTRSVHVDHCHKTGAVRGVLCVACNTALGHLRDSADSARRAAAYLDDGQALARVRVCMLGARNSQQGAER